MVSKQAEEWQLQSELREQMQGYKRMRHQHKHQVLATHSVLCSGEGRTLSQFQSAITKLSKKIYGAV